MLRRCWYAVALVGALADGPIARRVLGTDVVVWDTGDGPAAALDRCPHRYAPLSAGWVACGRVVCPYHGWEFGPDGAAVHLPQLEPDLPIPRRAALATVACVERIGMVWVCLDDDPLPTIPDVPEYGAAGWRAIPEYEWSFSCAAPHLIENNLDPAHIAFVHRRTFGSPSRPRPEIQEVERTAFGLRARSVVPVEGRHGRDGRTNRHMTMDLHAPFTGVFRMAYADGLEHVMVKACTPVDDAHTRLVQVVLRNDAEADAPAADIVAFDEAVEAEDADLLSLLPTDWEPDLTAQVHLRVDRAAIEMRRLLASMLSDAWTPTEDTACPT